MWSSIMQLPVQSSLAKLLKAKYKTGSKDASYMFLPHLSTAVLILASVPKPVPLA
jgi:hypothetical protein